MTTDHVHARPGWVAPLLQCASPDAGARDSNCVGRCASVVWRGTEALRQMGLRGPATALAAACPDCFAGMGQWPATLCYLSAPDFV